METKDNKPGNIVIPNFKTVKKGLDPEEVQSFVNALILRNKELAEQVKYIDSMRKLAEKTIVEAHEEAETIKIEILNEANDKANAVIAEAEKRGKADAERVIAEAEAKAEQDKKQKINAAIQDGQVLINDAEKKAESIRLVAQREAEKIIEEARIKAENVAKQRRELAEKEAALIVERILEEGRARAEQEALNAQKRMEQQVERSKIIAVAELREKFSGLYKEWLSSLEDVGEDAAADLEVNGSSVSLADIEIAEGSQSEVAADEDQWKLPSSAEIRGGGENEILYDGHIELQFPALSNLDQMLRLIRRLRGIPQMKVMNLAISPDKSIVVNAFLETPTLLLGILETIPEVDKASAASHDTPRKSRGGRYGGRPTAKRIVVTTKT